jgi:hypothetical protein
MEKIGMIQAHGILKIRSTMYFLLYSMRPYDDDTEPPGEPPPEGTSSLHQLWRYHHDEFLKITS